MFRHQLYVQQLSFYTRVLLMNKTRWPYLALMEHLKRPSKSPYFKYIHKIRTELGLSEAPLTPTFLAAVADEHFLKLVKDKISNIPALTKLESLSPQSYLCESLGAQWYAKYRLNQVPLGRHYVREGHVNEQENCPLCVNTTPKPNNPFHIVMECPFLNDIRKVTGILSYINFN